MKSPVVFVVSGSLALLASTAVAEDVRLPAPVLEWSIYILLIFAACVAIGISVFMRQNNGSRDSLYSLLDGQNPQVHAVRLETTVTDCVRKMNELRIGAMLVMEDDRLLGIFTERDAMNRVLAAGLDPARTEVSGVMTQNPVEVPGSMNLEEAMVIVTSRRIRHLPVVEDGKVIGVVSSGDITHRLVGS